jgi:hypothetical protein
MRPRIVVLLLLIALAGAVPACTTPKDKKEEEAKKKPDKKKEEERIKHSIADVSEDPSFQSFIGRLRLAVQRRDRATISSLMAPDFGWRWENPQPGNPFEYWDQNNSWGELGKLLNDKFTPNGNFMVSPPAFAHDSTFRGYRMGIRQVNGAWKFAYFVTGEDVLQ